MRTELQEKVTMFHTVNDITLRGEIVVFGSTFMANFPFYELSKRYVMESAVYNRSVEELTLSEAEEVLGTCVLEIKPQKIFLSLGEKDLANPTAVTTYARILKKIRTELPEAKVFVLPVAEGSAGANEGDRVAFNEKLKALAERNGASFLELPHLNSRSGFYECIFKKLHCFFRGNRLTLAEAFSYGE